MPTEYLMANDEMSLDIDEESLSIEHIIEIQTIRKILIHHPDLLAMFELMCIITNKRLLEGELT